MRELTEKENKISHDIIGAAIYVHRNLGPGLLEKVYEECLCHMLMKKGYSFERQKALPVKFENVYLDAGFRLDLLVEDFAVIELKTVEKILPVHEAQIQTYLKLSQNPLGLLFNFYTDRLKNGGIRRFVMT